jgi:hypothetical protein
LDLPLTNPTAALGQQMPSTSSWMQLLHLQPLWGGGFLVALCQLSLFYYVLGAVLHWVVPLLGPVRGIQEAPRKPGEVGRDAVNSIGEQQAQQRIACQCAYVLDVFVCRHTVGLFGSCQ